MNAIPSTSHPNEASAEHADIVITALSEAPVMRAFGHEVQFLLSGKQTNGRLTMFLDNAPPGLGSPLHYHKHEDEWFAECAKEFQRAVGPDMKHIAALAAGLGMHFVEDEGASGLLNNTANP